MVIRKRKKSRKYRGSRRHGWGITKGHKKSGIRGGYGRAGRFSHRWIYYIVKEPEELKKKGFTRHPSLVKRYKTINIAEIEGKLHNWLKSGVAKIDGDVVTINLKELGYEKLLGAGYPTRKYRLTIDLASEGAIEKIKNAGGDVSVAE